MERVGTGSAGKTKRKVQTDADIKRKAVKLVIYHLKKKASKEFVGSDHVMRWIAKMEELLQEEEFDLAKYVQMRRELNDVIERILDEDMRYRIRDSWYSFGRALDKKAKR